MAIDRTALRFLLLARAKGVSFARTTTLGRLTMYLDETGLEETFTGFGQALKAGEVQQIVRGAAGYSDNLFGHLGAAQVDSIDASDYQQATIAFDLNQSLPDVLRRGSTAVLDFGTLEHVFDVARALANCMDMVAMGGHLLMAAPANNWFGHGFYQFSPEFYFRALTATNGFQVEYVFLATHEPDQPWYSLRDPAEMGNRAQAPVRDAPLLILVMARRVNDSPPLTSMPKQSDYETAWGAHQSRSRQLARRAVPSSLKRVLAPRVAGHSRSTPAIVEVSPESLAQRP